MNTPFSEPSEIEAPAGVWIEIDTARLAANVAAFRQHVDSSVLVGAVVKANGYGHGLALAARAFVDGGADWLCVHSKPEADAVAALGLGCPILVLGPLLESELETAVAAGYELTVYDQPRLERLDAVAASVGRAARVHLKVETGTQRQGVPLEQFDRLLRRVRDLSHVELSGVSSHFANIEDTTRHEFAQHQSALFAQARDRVNEAGFVDVKWHMASSAATILFSHTHHDLVRVGISAYGCWPSRETLVSAREKSSTSLDIAPALTWKTVVAQVKNVPAGSFIGYGCTDKAESESTLAVLPVGYADGYRRTMGRDAHVLLRGRRCPVRGRICMNLIMVDVSALESVEVGESVVLLGGQGDEEITAETMAGWAGTIHYEILAGLSPALPRVAV